MGITHNEPVVAQGVLVLEEVLQIYIFEKNSFCVFFNISPSARGGRMAHLSGTNKTCIILIFD